jgi:hypothetical protein
MYQETLDALDTNKTTRQHLNAMKDLYDRATDSKLKALIGAVGSEFEGYLQEMKKLANRQTQSPVSKQNNVAKAKAARKMKFIPSSPMADGKVALSVTALIDYCNSMI